MTWERPKKAESRQRGRGRKTWLREAGPAFQELAQIPAEATTLLCCPNHTCSFFLAAPPGTWQAQGFLEQSVGWGPGWAGPRVGERWAGVERPQRSLV